MKYFLKLFLILLFLVLTDCLRAQQVFKHSYVGGVVYSSPESSLITEWDPSYLYLGRRAGVYILKLDKSGIPYDSVQIFNIHPDYGFYSYSNQYYLLNGNNLMIACGGDQFGYHDSLFLVSYDLLNDSIEWKMGYSGIFDPYISLQPSIDNGYVMSTVDDPDFSPNYPTPILLYTDSTGNIVKKYQFIGHDRFSDFAYQLPDYNFMLGILTRYEGYCLIA
jgi:hypothetical protein